MNYRQIYARKAECEKRIKEVCPQATHDSGIYCFTRVDEDGFKFAYVGLASKSLLARLGEHLVGYQHIDLSIKKHGLDHEVTITMMELPYGCEGAHDVAFYERVLRNILDAGIPFDSLAFKDASGTSIMRVPASGFSGAYFLRTDCKPGISNAATSSSLRPQSASAISAILYSEAIDIVKI